MRDWYATAKAWTSLLLMYILWNSTSPVGNRPSTMRMPVLLRD